MANQWYLTIDGHVVGKTYRSLTQQLLFARYLACEIFTERKIYRPLGEEVEPVVIRVMFNGVEQAKDVI